VVLVRHYELMIILEPSLDERTVTPTLERFLGVVRKDGGTVENIEVWGRRRLAYEIAKNAEGIYAVVDVTCEPATVAELDRQLTLNESVLRTKVLRVEGRRVAPVGGPARAPSATSGATSTAAGAATS
jgi:small subunit ribosomal protein S6